MNPDRQAWWSPEYSTDGKDRRLYYVDEVRSAECPVSVSTGDIQHLIQLEAQNRQLKEASGASLYGPNSSRWPAWWVDVVTTLETQRVLEHNARIAAMS